MGCFFLFCLKIMRTKSCRAFNAADVTCYYGYSLYMQRCQKAFPYMGCLLHRLLENLIDNTDNLHKLANSLISFLFFSTHTDNDCDCGLIKLAAPLHQRNTRRLICFVLPSATC